MTAGARGLPRALAVRAHMRAAGAPLRDTDFTRLEQCGDGGRAGDRAVTVDVAVNARRSQTTPFARPRPARTPGGGHFWYLVAFFFI